MRTIGLTTLALIAFAANSVLCRVALREGLVDPATFSSIRLASGAVALVVLTYTPRRPRAPVVLSWASAGWLALYAVPFAVAYTSLDTGTGALILFGCVQATMLAAAVWSGDRPHPAQWAGLAAALAGLLYLVFPGLSAPPLGFALLMGLAGVAWGRYSLRGRGVANPLAATTGNFVGAVPMALAVSAAGWPFAHAEAAGVWLAVASGTFASAVGYVLWYAALPGLGATRAAIVQLSVPVLAAAGGVLLLNEVMAPRLLPSSVAILGGVALAIVAPARHRAG
jgi:drug/metabolite transporter (DMT)-like permease